MKHAAEIAHFRQLCCLGIDAQTAMPSLLRALHGLIGSNSNSFYWASHSGEIANVYMEQWMPKDILSMFLKDFLNNPARKFSALDLRNYMPKGKIIGNTSKVFPKSFLQSDVYNLIWRPQSRKHMLWARVHDADSRVNGVTLSRVVGESEFSDRDEQLLLQVVPYFAHALNGPAESPAQLVESGESAVVIVNHQGAVEHESSEGRRLLLLASHTRLSSGTVDWRGDVFVSTLIQKLLNKIVAIRSGRPAAPPVVEHQNPWGKFILRAYPMDADGPTTMGPIVILIERHVPLKLKLLEAMQASPLSAKQKEVCLLLSEGFSYQNMATRLGVKPSTVIDHVRKIYDKLDVSNHHELLSKLAQGTGAAGAQRYH